MSLNYDNIMEQLDKCLGLESSATEGVGCGKKTKVAKECNEKAAYSDYDEIETELADNIGSEDQGDFIFGEEGSGEEPTPEDNLRKALGEYCSSLGDQELSSDEIKERVQSVVDEVLIPKDPENQDDVDEGSATEDTDLVDKLMKSGKGDYYGDDTHYADGSPKLPDSERQRLAANDPDLGSAIPPAAAKESIPQGGSLTDRLLAMAGEAIDGETQEMSAEESYRSGKMTAEEFLEKDYQEKASKMLARYESLADKSQLNKKRVAVEGLGEVEVALDEEALRKTSSEFGYDGKKLKNMVVEAIQKGVIG